ncbi:MAG: hypothetical protein GYA39_00525 [Methanothrix sp.]|nr:hypothetical protein [Methanothrix sp.]
MEKNMFERVLVPTDFSIHSRRVLECVAYCPEIKEAVLAHVVLGGARALSRSRRA